MVALRKGKSRTIRWAIEAHGNALAFLDKSAANEVVRNSMELSGADWGAVFFPKRFGDYVDRPPFPYPSHRLGFFLGKARRMGVLKQIIGRLSVTKGWDPWSTDKPPFSLIVEWKKLNPGKYNLRDRVFSSGLIGDMRRNAKRAVMEVIDEMWGDGKFVPLIESGALKKTAMAGIKYKATATSGTQTLRISTPIPYRDSQRDSESKKGGISPTVGAVLKTMPEWEVDWFAKKMGEHIADILNSEHGLSQNARGMVTQGERSGNQSGQRASTQAQGRSS